MQAYIIRRVLLLIPTLFLVTVIVFLLVRFIPGDVVELLIMEMESSAAGATEIDREAVEELLGLDQPIPVQYGRWIGVLPHPDEGFNGILQGNLGHSLRTGKSVKDEFLIRWPVTLELGIMAMVIGACISLPIGIISAIRQDTLEDYVSRSFAIGMMAFPSFWLATIIIIYGGIWFGWAPEMEFVPFHKDPAANLRMFVLPALLMGLYGIGGIMRITRTMMLEVMRQDYIRTAWAKGLRERSVIWRHAIKNAFIPVVTVMGGQLGMLIGGSVIIEQIFCLPGIGRLTIDALNQRDYPIISAMNLIMASFVMFNHLFIDLLYAVLDPRVKYA